MTICHIGCDIIKKSQGLWHSADEEVKVALEVREGSSTTESHKFVIKCKSHKGCGTLPTKMIKYHLRRGKVAYATQATKFVIRYRKCHKGLWRSGSAEDS